jgi:hypothetical protein
MPDDAVTGLVGVMLNGEAGAAEVPVVGMGPEGGATTRAERKHQHHYLNIMDTPPVFPGRAAVVEMLSTAQFQDYRANKPPAAGWYIWRLPHKSIDGLVVIFLAEYRLRGAGHKNVLSPDFDHWDGYQVLLPKGPIEWAEYGGEKPKPGKELLDLVGVKNTECPFCKKEPAWRYRGRFIGSGPTNTEYFYLECCNWFNGFGSRMADPVKLANKRNEALS